ncbi:metalloprotease TldD [Candidatus Ishikawella capsulata]|uniref:Predicted peptidase n=1 Tax=Candidatus Ishikawaella capsulata Mpkobe TaxID=476281 RepID=C5WCI9_9ENTR|nr:metalloprotease TldD [Candidatus Ishikawaella capsulata]BAH83045.1 predicted peptidase [Candidatus Ishikawaella capsulata Mpkobe]
MSKNNVFQTVNEQLLTANSIYHNDLYALLEQLTERKLDYADIYFQNSYEESWCLEDNIIKEGSYHINNGVGIRAINGEKTGFAYSDQINLNSLRQSVEVARSIVEEQGVEKPYKLSSSKTKRQPVYNDINPLMDFTAKEKILLLQQINKIARNADSRVQEVNVHLYACYEPILIAATDGTFAADVRPLIRLSISVLVEENGKRESGSSGGGARTGYSFLLDKIHGEMRSEFLAKEAVRIALIKLAATNAPAGAIPVVLGPGWPGILLHEAVGHGLEGDFNRRGTSVFTGKIGELVASELCTVIDNGLLNNHRGSVAVDDEGVPGQYNILIEQGILKQYLQDKLNARLMDMQTTGNGRRQSYAHLPMPRMTNTYMLPGESTPEEIIQSVDFGLYAPNFSGGQVDITSGKFVFCTSEAYLIEKGKITKPVKGATLIGSGIEVMQQISMVGNDLKIDPGIGICGKEGQNIPVGVGQPTLKLNKITVGGSA